MEEIEMGTKVKFLSNFNNGFDRAECGIGEFIKFRWHIFKGDAVGDPETGIDFTVANQLNDMIEIFR